MVLVLFGAILVLWVLIIILCYRGWVLITRKGGELEKEPNLLLRLFFRK